MMISIFLLIKKDSIKTWNEEWITLLCQINCLNDNFEQLLDAFNVIENEDIQKMIAEQIIILGSIEEVELGCLENQELFEASL
jgi:hypothetical protein